MPPLGESVDQPKGSGLAVGDAGSTAIVAAVAAVAGFIAGCCLLVALLLLVRKRMRRGPADKGKYPPLHRSPGQRTIASWFPQHAAGAADYVTSRTHLRTPRFDSGDATPSTPSLMNSPIKPSLCSNAPTSTPATIDKNSAGNIEIGPESDDLDVIHTPLESALRALSRDLQRAARDDVLEGI